MQASSGGTMNDIQMSKFLGWFSLGLGGLELLAGGALRRRLGLAVSPGVVRGFGAREIASGAMVLTNPGKAAPIWVRTGGDAMDILTLAGALMRPGNHHRAATTLALVAVLGVTALDVMTATSLQDREARALRVARAGRVA